MPPTTQPVAGSGAILIYRIRNTINGKCYIGKTMRSLGQRFDEHKCKAANNPTHKLHRAMRKYGFTNFVIELAGTAETEDQAFMLERHLIKQEATRKTGYNMTDGGETPDAELARTSAIAIWARPEFREKRRQAAIHRRRSRAASKAAKKIWAARQQTAKASTEKANAP